MPEAAFAGFFLLFALGAFVLFGIVLPLWTYSDAQRNSPQNPVLWALVVFFGGLLGFLLYFLIGRD
jgi:hypothetical protein